MADSGALRQRRSKAHKAGDHSLCKRCAAVRGEPGGPHVPFPAGARAALEWLAERLAEDYLAQRGNAMLARELRMTLEKLLPAGKDRVDDELADILASMPSPVGHP